MKRFFIVALVSGLALLSACANNQKKRKALLDDVFDTHEKVMNDEAKVQLKSMQLDTLLKLKPALKEQITPLKAELDAADNNMMDWMHQFNPELGNKSSDEAVKYLTDQKQRLSKVDAQLMSVTDKAGKFISLNK